MNIDAIRAAAQRLSGHVRRTPLLSSPFLDAIAGRPLWVKAECLQHTGSFKYRGGLSAVSALDPSTRGRGIVAYSSGNHAQGVALAARQHGCPAVIVMPKDAPAIKIANTRALGAEVVLYDRWSEDRDAIGADLAQRRGLTLIRPYDDPEVIAGQGTVGLDIAAQAAKHTIARAEVLICCGGGGLTSGVALALADEAPEFTIRPVEPEGYDDVARSLSAGRILHNENPPATICDAIVTPQPGALTFPILSRLCGPGLSVSDDEAMRAMALAFSHLRIVLEPGGAVALAAALFRPASDPGRPVIAIATGGNVEPATFSQALKHGEGKSGGA